MTYSRENNKTQYNVTIKESMSQLEKIRQK
jgi:hypothetical protein